MRKYLSLLITASFLVMSQGVIASPLSNREEIAAASPAPSNQRAPQTQATSSSHTLMPSDVPPNMFTKLHLLAQTVLVECMENDPKGTLSLLEVSNGLRRLALPMKGRNDVSVNVSNKLKQHLLAVLIGGQTGDVERFMRDQGNAFKILSVDHLRAIYVSKEFNGTLSPLTRHGRQYLSIGEKDLNGGTFRLQRMSLRLAPLNFPGSNGIKILYLDNNNLTVAPDLSHLKLLEYLTFENNQLTVTPNLSNLTLLEYLTFENNQLMDTPNLSNLTLLEYLNLENNKLTVTPNLSNLRLLNTLNLSNNQLTVTPDFSQLTALSTICLLGNQLTIAPNLSQLKGLGWIYLDATLCGDATLLATLKDLNKGKADKDKILLFTWAKRCQRQGYVEVSY